MNRTVPGPAGVPTCGRTMIRSTAFVCTARVAPVTGTSGPSSSICIRRAGPLCPPAGSNPTTVPGKQSPFAITTTGGFHSIVAPVSRMNLSGFSVFNSSRFSNRYEDPGSGHAVSDFVVSRVPSRNHAKYRSAASPRCRTVMAKTKITNQIRCILQSLLPTTFPATPPQK